MNPSIELKHCCRRCTLWPAASQESQVELDDAFGRAVAPLYQATAELGAGLSSSPLRAPATLEGQADQATAPDRAATNDNAAMLVELAGAPDPMEEDHEEVIVASPPPPPHSTAVAATAGLPASDQGAGVPGRSETIDSTDSQPLRRTGRRARTLSNSAASNGHCRRTVRWPTTYTVE